MDRHYDIYVLNFNCPLFCRLKLLYVLYFGGSSSGEAAETEEYMDKWLGRAHEGRGSLSMFLGYV
jgi:hypothetical protein